MIALSADQSIFNRLSLHLSSIFNMQQSGGHDFHDTKRFVATMIVLLPQYYNGFCLALVLKLKFCFKEKSQSAE